MESIVKKPIAILLALLCIALLAGCGSGERETIVGSSPDAPGTVTSPPG